ncbi:MAG: FecR domain-containing protein [Deltaproteobacteria bacterium]|nr:FecR domain-containing protein [Deltaproteobacteria bacterium]
MSDRATGAVRDLYQCHLRECRDCRKMHRLLYALYEGPAVPPPPAGVDEEREFHAALRRLNEERPAPWYHKWSLRAGVTALAGAATALALHLVTPASFGTVGETLAVAEQSSATERSATNAELAAQGGMEHPAQSYGRVLGGHADVVTGQPQSPSNTTDTFPVGTRFQVDAAEALQVGMVGKIVANFTRGADVEWSLSTPSLLELKVHRGIAAVRYDRRPSDPILHVRTSDAVVRVIGTVFTVEVDDSGETIVSVLRGQVEVVDPETMALKGEVESGDRYEVSPASHGTLGRIEVEAAMPLSNETDGESGDFANTMALADGFIPSSWNVPGLPDDPKQRTLMHVPAPSAEATTFEVPVVRRRSPKNRGNAVYEGDTSPMVVDDEAGDLIDRLMQDVKETRGRELQASLDQCRTLYYSRNRYRAARCLSTFITTYGDEPAAVEGHLLVGMLRMDFALDYRAADRAFEEFLRRAPRSHPSAELAMFRLWLSATEDGRITEALRRGRRYLKRFPNGKYVGKLLQRFDELKSDL